MKTSRFLISAAKDLADPGSHRLAAHAARSRPRSSAPLRSARSGRCSSAHLGQGISTFRTHTSWGRRFRPTSAAGFRLAGGSRTTVRRRESESIAAYHVPPTRRRSAEVPASVVCTRHFGFGRPQRVDRRSGARVVLEHHGGPVAFRRRAVRDRGRGRAVVVLARDGQTGSDEEHVPAGGGRALPLGMERILGSGHLQLVHVDGRMREEEAAALGHRRTIERGLEDGHADLVRWRGCARAREREGGGDDRGDAGGAGSRATSSAMDLSFA